MTAPACIRPPCDNPACRAAGVCRKAMTEVEGATTFPNPIAAGSEPVPSAIPGGKLAASAGRLRVPARLPAAFFSAAAALVAPAPSLGAPIDGPPCLPVEAAVSHLEQAGLSVAGQGRSSGGAVLLQFLSENGRFVFVVIIDRGRGQGPEACLVSSGIGWQARAPDPVPEEDETLAEPPASRTETDL